MAVRSGSWRCAFSTALPSRRAPLACVVRRARADHEVVVVEVRHEPRRVRRLMLSVGVDDQDERAGRLADAGLDGGAVALVVRMADDARAGGGRPRAGVVVEPSSTTRISRQRAAAARPRTTDPIDAASLNAGMTIERRRRVSSSHRAISHQLVSTTPSQLIARARSKPASPSDWACVRFAASRAIAAPTASGVGSTTSAVDAVLDELERAAGVRRGHDRLAREKRFERHVAVVLVERRKDDGAARPRTARPASLVVHAAGKRDAIGDARSPPPLSSSCARSGPSPTTISRTPRADVRERADDEIDALVGFEAADRQDVVAERAGIEPAGERRRMIERLGREAVVPREPRRRCCARW